MEEGETTIETSEGCWTVRPVEPLIRPDTAVMLVLPGPTPLAKPPALMVATETVDEVHVTEFVTSALAPLLYVPVARNCWFAP